jgi:guanylate kinase
MLERAEEEGKDLLLDVDIRGAAKVRRQIPDAVTIFVLPPSLDVLRERLIRRGKDTAEQIATRIENARMEIEQYVDYDYIIVNRDLASAFENLSCIVNSRQCLRKKMEEQVREVVESFRRLP